MINQITQAQSSYKSSLDITEFKNSDIQKTTVNFKEQYEENSVAVYSHDDTAEVDAKLQNYQVDMEKIQQMKDETDQRMLEMFRNTVKGTGLKQLGGVRGILDKLRQGEKVTLEIEYTVEDVEQAKVDVAEGGYWSAEETSDRLVDFAKALSGNNPEKAEMLKDAFEKAFKEIEEMFGGELPQLSYDTFDKTMEKFDLWANGDS